MKDESDGICYIFTIKIRRGRLFEGSINRSLGQLEPKRPTIDLFPWNRETQQKKSKFDTARRQIF